MHHNVLRDNYDLKQSTYLIKSLSKIHEFLHCGKISSLIRMEIQRANSRRIDFEKIKHKFKELSFATLKTYYKATVVK